MMGKRALGAPGDREGTSLWGGVRGRLCCVSWRELGTCYACVHTGVCRCKCARVCACVEVCMRVGLVPELPPQPGTRAKPAVQGSPVWGSTPLCIPDIPHAPWSVRHGRGAGVHPCPGADGHGKG